MTIRVLLLLVLGWLLCAPSGAWAQQPGTTADAAAKKSLYHIGAGDVLSIQVFGEDELSGSFPVSLTGGLDFPLLGPVMVAGRTTAEISLLLRDRLAGGFVRNPHVTVSVTTYASQPVQVLGAVSKPGVYFLQGPTTVLEILSLAGGVDDSGVDEVRITHESGQGDTVVIPYERLLAPGTESVALAAGDIVFVPQSVVSVMGSVAKPGEITLREGLTVSRALAAAGGALPTANLRKVWVLRGEERTAINVRKVLDGKQADFVLSAGDRVIVDESMF